MGFQRTQATHSGSNRALTLFTPNEVPTLQELASIALIMKHGSVEKVEEYIRHNPLETLYDCIKRILAKIKKLHRSMLENNVKAIDEFLKATPSYLLPVLLKTKSAVPISAAGIQTSDVIKGDALIMAITAEAVGRYGCELYMPSEIHTHSTSLTKLVLFIDSDSDSLLKYYLEDGQVCIIECGHNEGQLNPEHFYRIKNIISSNASAFYPKINIDHFKLSDRERNAFAALIKITQNRGHTLFVNEEDMLEMLHRHIKRACWSDQGDYSRMAKQSQRLHPGVSQQTLGQLLRGWEQKEENQVQILSESDLDVEDISEITYEFFQNRRRSSGFVLKAQKKQSESNSLYGIKYFANPDLSIEEMKTRAKHELRVWTKLLPVKNSAIIECKGFVKVPPKNYQTFREDGCHVSRYALLFDWTDGGSLRDNLNKYQFSAADLKDWAIHLVGGLKALHENGLVHANIALRNIGLKTQPDGRILPIFNNLSSAIFKGEKPLKQQYQFRHIPNYAPEVQTDNPQFSEKSDIYSLGIILLDIINQHPSESYIYTGDMRNYSEYYTQFISENSRAKYGNLIHVLLTMIHPNPKKRPDAAMALENLTRCLLPRSEPEEPTFQSAHILRRSFLLGPY